MGQTSIQNLSIISWTIKRNGSYLITHFMILKPVTDYQKATEFLSTIPIHNYQLQNTSAERSHCENTILLSVNTLSTSHY